MISNSIKIYSAIIAFFVAIGGSFVMGITYQKNKDDVKSLKEANTLLMQDKYNKDRIIDLLNSQIESSERANNRLEFERDTISLEYDYANSVIQKYQAKLNSRTFIDSSFVRYLQYTEQSKRLSGLDPNAFIFASTSESATASGILSYYNALNQSLDECYAQNQAIKDWYDDSREKYNRFINARIKNK